LSAPTPVVIAGAGNLGKLLFDCLDGDERWHILGFIDDGHAGGTCFDLPVYSSEDYDPRLTRNAFMAIGYPQMRRAMVARLAPLQLDWRRFIDRRAMVGRGATLGTGVLVLSFAMVASGVRIGDFTYLSSYAHVGTGATVGDYTSILPAASVGESVIGSDCVLGLRSACLDGATIGDGATLAPFTLVRRVIPAGALVAGSPARIVPRNRDAEPE
jgi:sugar O-acyltransferase (sialic acid O-acetyltransferase NeuD family)